jgi:mRNA interferase RelE/StbE
LTHATSSNNPQYTIQIDRGAEKTLRKQPRNLAARIIKAIFALADNPHPPNSLKVEGHDYLYRLRVGDWRIIYQVDDDQLLILVLEIGSRSDIYRTY